MTIGLLEAATPHYITHDLLPIVVNEVEFNLDSDYLFFPDAGAQKRYGKIWPGVKQLVGYKVRDFVTGEIKSLEVVGELPLLPNTHKIIIVDDLSMRGGTFFQSANKLKTLGFDEIYLVVGHCLETIISGELLKQKSPIKKVFTTDTVIDKSLASDKLAIYNWNMLL
jgi:ribose-phosphate pyrophosphokinase